MSLLMELPWAWIDIVDGECHHGLYRCLREGLRPRIEMLLTSVVVFSRPARKGVISLVAEVPRHRQTQLAPLNA